MHFENGFLYHVFNHGNNRQKIFFSRENYLFFLKKIKSHITPFADILAWCLMPNHFHLMILVNKTELFTETFQSKQKQISGDIKKLAQKTLNSSIGIMLRSYTRAVNLQLERSGGLFREETKAICLNCNHKVTHAWFVSQGITNINMSIPEREYPSVCYNYILLNPLKDGLVKKAEDWEFSSYQDIMGIRNGTLISREKIKTLGLEVNINNE
jgi:putative transposase